MFTPAGKMPKICLLAFAQPGPQSHREGGQLCSSPQPGPSGGDEGGRGGMDSRMMQGLLSAALTTQSPGHHSCPYHTVLFRAEVGGMGPFGI